MSDLAQHEERKEDRRLLTGRGRYVGDTLPADTLHMAVLRAPIAAGTLAGLDLTAARAVPGVVDVITAADLADLPGPIPLYTPHPALRDRTPWPLVRDRVTHVGEPVAAVLATSRYAAEDGRDAIVATFNSEPATTDLETALAPGAALVHPDLGSNLAAAVSGRVGDPAAAFAAADHVAKVRLRLGRQSPQPMETRGLLAHWDPAEALLTVRGATQSAHMVRRILAYLLNLPEASVRVLVGDVGGGFGGKNRFYPEELLAAFLTKRHARPVLWIADRYEDLLTMYMEREQVQTGELALRRDGTILGLRIFYLDDTGAYTPFGLVCSQMTAVNAVGPYRIPAVDFRYQVAYTHKAGMAPYRGAGRPQGTFLIERLMDRAAADLGLDPAALRLKNLITAAEQPYDTGLVRDGRSMVYDGGDYPRAYREALERVGYADFPARQAAARAQGRHLGVGTSIAVEVASTNTAEGARVFVDRAGKVAVWTSACSAGQGLETVLAGVCAEHLGVDPADVTVAMADTFRLPFGGGTFASRSAVSAGNAVADAAGQVRERALLLAAVFLEASPSDLELVAGVVRVKGAPERAVTLAALAESATYPNTQRKYRWPAGKAFPWGDGQGLDATAYFRPDFTYGYSAHAAVVEVEPDTGRVQVLEYVVVHDSGKVLSPAVVDGQVRGAVAQGIGAALLEEVIYDAGGQHLSGSFADYLLPTAAEVPNVELGHLETPAPNPLGVKGAGEGGLIPGGAVICAAIDSALKDRAIFCARIPVTPERLWRLVQGG